MERFELIAPCHFGLEAVLKREILDLGYEISKVEDGKVSFWGDEEAVAYANMFLRTAERVLLKAGEFKACTYDELFEKTKALPWEEYIPENGKFWVKKASSIKSKLFSPSDIQSIMKKAMVERMKQKYHILKAYDGLQAIEIMKKEEVHLILLDIMMPNLDGIRATRKIRETSSVPIIMLSAKSEDVDKILGLNIGADDYITKPFNPLELIARVKSQLRRYTQLGNLATEEKEAVYVCGGLVVNDDLKTVTVDGEPVKLTPIEYNILVLLIKNQGKVFSIEQIYENIWNEEAIGADNTVAVHIRHIREKIEINPREPRYLKVVWGIGYKIEKM